MYQQNNKKAAITDIDIIKGFLFLVIQSVYNGIAKVMLRRKYPAMETDMSCWKKANISKNGCKANNINNKLFFK